MNKLFLLLCWLLSSCNERVIGQSIPEDSIVSVRVTSQFPDFNWDEDIYKPKLVKYDPMKANIFYLKDQVIYQVYYQSTETDAATNVTKYEFRSYYFVHAANKTFGLLYDTFRGINGKKVRADSALRKIWAYPPNLMDPVNLSLISRSNNTPSALDEQYSFRSKKDTSLTGTIHLYYTDDKDLQDIPYSFSIQLDTIKKKKLYKVELINNARYVEYAKTYMEKVDNFYLMERVPVENEKFIRELFNNEKQRAAELK